MIKINAVRRLKAAAATSTRAVEKAIKKKTGLDVKLYKGRGYYYFADPDDSPGDLVSTWRHSSVAVYKLGDMSLEDWVSEFERMKAEEEKWR